MQQALEGQGSLRRAFEEDYGRFSRDDVAVYHNPRGPPFDRRYQKWILCFISGFIKQVSPKAIIPVHTEQTPRRYEELLSERGVKTIVIPPEGGVPIPL